MVRHPPIRSVAFGLVVLMVSSPGLSLVREVGSLIIGRVMVAASRQASSGPDLGNG